jgi:hypothetical protein
MNSFDEVVRVAVVADTDRLSSSHARLLDALAQSTLAGFRVDLPGSGVPVGPRHDLVHVLTATPDAVAVAAEHGIGLVASFPAAATGGLARVCQVILSPGPRADAELLLAGARPGQLRRWQPGVDPECFGPGHYDAAALSRSEDRINVLSVGEPEHPALLAAAFGAAAAAEPRLHLVLIDANADLPRLYASGDLLLHVSSSGDFPLAIIEAQASGLPVLAVDTGAARELIEDGRTGVLVPAEPEALAEALISLARRAALRERLTVGGLGAVAAHSWARSLEQLTQAWVAALAAANSGLMRAA